MSLKELFGWSREIAVLDLIIPLSEATTYTIEEVERGSNLGFDEAHHVLDAMVERKLLVKSDAYPAENKPVYRKSSHSKCAWALENLIHAIYADKLRVESLAKMAPKKKKKGAAPDTAMLQEGGA